MSDCTVMFCCNDEHGMPTGRVECVEIADEIRLETDDPPTFSFREPSRIHLGRRRFTATGRQSMVGNVFWDSARMSVVSARLLVEHLIVSGWSVTEYAEEGPFAELVKGARHEG